MSLRPGVHEIMLSMDDENENKSRFAQGKRFLIKLKEYTAGIADIKNGMIPPRKHFVLPRNY